MSEVLTVTKSFKDGNCTFSLMSNGKVHVNNHVTNKKSMWIDSDKLRSLFKD